MLRALFLSLLIVAPLSAQETKPKDVKRTEARKSSTVVPVPRKDEWWQHRHDKFLERTKQGGVDVAFIGDSITQGWEGAGKEAWEKSFAPLKAANYGIGGDQTQHVLWRITEGKELEGISPKLAVIMIGTNNVGGNSADQIAMGVEAIVKELRRQKPEMKILLLGVFPRGGKRGEHDDHLTASELQPKIGQINAHLAKMDDGKHVVYMDIGKVFLESDGSMSKKVMPDYLHLSPDGYHRWTDAILPKVKELLGQS